MAALETRQTALPRSSETLELDPDAARQYVDARAVFVGLELQPDRDALKRRRDLLQADAVDEMLQERLPQLAIPGAAQ